MPGFTLAPGADPAAATAALAGLERDLSTVPSGLADRVLIAAGEVVANAAEHGRGPVVLTWDVREDCVDLDVIGPGPSASEICAAGLPPEGAVRGRGLYLIRSLATSVEPRRDGVRVRFS